MGSGCKDEHQGGDGPRTTPVVSGDKVYCFGTKLKLFCFSAADGKTVWMHDLAKEFYAAIQSGDSQAKFLYCISIIQLMENVYIDLNLEENASHPDNEGWKNIFLLWWSSPTFKHAWEISRSTFGSRFQRWCERELDKRR